MKLKEILKRLSEIADELKILQDELSKEDGEVNVDEVEEKANKLLEERKGLLADKKAIEEAKEKRNRLLDDIANGRKGTILKTLKSDDELDGEKLDKNEQTRKAINEFIRSRGQRVDGLKVVDAGALVPKEILKPQEKQEDILDLTKYVNEVNVNSGSGTYPVLAKSGAKMHTVAELEENPELAKPKIIGVDYKIETYRGALAVSNETIDDADYDIIGLIRDDIISQELNTRNDAISAVLKKATAKSAKDLDELKTLSNKAIPKIYNTKWIMSSTMYNELDLLKDKNGRYLIQDDVTAASGKSLFGKEVVVVDDALLGEEEAKVAFFGDPKAYLTYFNRLQTTVEWQEHNIYGKRLGCATRFDMKPVEKEAGVFVTYTGSPEL